LTLRLKRCIIDSSDQEGNEMNELDAAVAYLAAMREYAKAKAEGDADATNWAYRKMIVAHDNLWTTVETSL